MLRPTCRMAKDLFERTGKNHRRKAKVRHHIHHESALEMLRPRSWVVGRGLLPPFIQRKFQHGIARACCGRPDDTSTPQARTPDLHRSRFAHRFADRKSQRNSRPHPRGDAIYTGGTTWNHRSLWFFAILRRHFDHAGKGVCEDSVAGGRNGACGRNYQ